MSATKPASRTELKEYCLRRLGKPVLQINVDDTQVEALSKLPAKEELLVKLLFLLQAPATQLVRTLNEVPAKFVRTLAAVRDSKE